MDHDAHFDELITQGLAASGSGLGEAALDFFAQASAVQPRSGIPYFLIGSEQAAAGNTEAAESAFANAVLLAPDFALARYQLGLLQYSAGRAPVGLLTWSPLMALNEQASLGHFVRGLAALAQDQFAEGLGHFHAGLACKDVNPAVAGDIRQVVQSVEGLLADAKRPDVEGSAQHVLLSAYGRGLH